MTVPSEASLQAYTGNGATTAFAVPFPFALDDDIDVTLLLTGAGQTAVVQVQGTHYTLAGAGTASGTVTMLTAPPASSTLTISRTVAITQTVDLVTSGPFSPAVHTQALDKRTHVEQQLARRIATVEAIGDLTGLAAANANITALQTLTDGFTLARFASYNDQSRVWGVVTKTGCFDNTTQTLGVPAQTESGPGIIEPTVATPRAMNSYSTVATLNAVAGINRPGISAVLCAWVQRPRLMTLIQSYTSAATRRIWVTLTDADLEAVSSDAAARYVGLRYDTGVGDTTWVLCSSNGTTASGLSTGVAVSANTDYSIDLDFSAAGSLTARINGVVTTKTTDLPSGITRLKYVISVTTLAASVAAIAWHHTLLSRK